MQVLPPWNFPLSQSAGCNSRNGRRLASVFLIQGLFWCETSVQQNGRNLCVCSLVQHFSVDKTEQHFLKSRSLNYALGSAADSFGTGYFLRRSSVANWKKKS